MKKNKQLVSKIIIGFVLVVVVLVASIGSTLVWATNSIVHHSYMEKATLTAEALLDNLDMDKLEKLAANPKEGSLYTELQSQLTNMLEINPITYIYVVTPPKSGEAEGMTLLDGGALDSEDVYHIGETMDSVYYNEVLEGIEKDGSYSEFDENDLGDMISSYVPLKNGDGEIFAILGVDDTLVSMGDIKNSALRDVMPIFCIIIVIVGMVIMASIGFYLYRLLKPVGPMRIASLHLDEGNLAKSTDTMNEVDLSNKSSISVFGGAFKKAIASITDMIRNIRGVSKDVTATTNSIQKVSQTIDSSTNSFIHSIAEISDSVHEQETISVHMQSAMQAMADDIKAITAQVHKATSNLQHTSQLIEQSSSEASVVSTQVQSMSDSVKDTAANVQQLANRYSDIESMVNIIQGIADQTNLLALNASIEAARAGEHGKGFAVVADEVKKLAEMTKGSAEDIRQQIGDFKQVTYTVLEDMNASTSAVNDGAKQVQHISEGLIQVLQETEQVVSDVKVVEDITSKIGHAAREVSGAITKSTDATNRVAGSMGDVQSAADAQKETVIMLKEAMGQLTNSVASFDDMLKNYRV